MAPVGIRLRLSLHHATVLISMENTVVACLSSAFLAGIRLLPLCRIARQEWPSYERHHSHLGMSPIRDLSLP